MLHILLDFEKENSHREKPCHPLAASIPSFLLFTYARSHAILRIEICGQNVIGPWMPGQASTFQQL